jgi:hypothetical protein
VDGIEHQCSSRKLSGGLHENNHEEAGCGCSNGVTPLNQENNKYYKNKLEVFGIMTYMKWT